MPVAFAEGIDDGSIADCWPARGRRFPAPCAVRAGADPASRDGGTNGQDNNSRRSQTRVLTQFAKRDANRDGFLTGGEMAKRGGHRDGAMKTRRMGGYHAMLDPNVAFDRLDANRDGSISHDEFARNRVVQNERRKVMSRPGEPGAMHMKRGRGMRGGGMMGAAMLKMADANRDGRVSLAEANSGALRHFDMMDGNSDGRLTPKERALGREYMRQKRRAG